MEREVNGLKNPTRNWNSLQGKKEQESAMTPAKPASNDRSSWSTIMEGFPVPSPLLPPPSGTVDGQKQCNVATEDRKKDKLGQ